jgi:hypothetical protein
MGAVTAFEDTAETPAVRGFLHEPDEPDARGLVLTHGAGSNAGAPLLVALAEALATRGITVLRCDLPFRQARPRGSPSPSGAAQDRAGLQRAVLVLRGRVKGKIYLSGISYGGRQASMLVAEQSHLVAGLMLLSYPLHAPGRSDLRTAHFPQLSTPSLFIHGTRDPFGSVEEMQTALELLAGPHELITIQGAGHDLGGKGSAPRIAGVALEAWSKRYG